MKKRIALAICSFMIAIGGIGMSSLPHEELPVSEELLAEAMEEEEPEEVIEEVAEVKVCLEGCTLEEGHEGECVVKEEEIEVILKTTSMERDLKVKFVNKKTGKVISGADFKMKLTSPSKKTKEYSDHDNDGIIWVKDIDGGNYTIEMLELEGYVTAKNLTAEVKKKIEYKVVEVADEVKSESEVNVSQEDGAYGGAEKDDSTSGSAKLEDTVEYVASTKKEVTKTTEVQKKDSFGQLVYEKQKVDALGQPVYAKILSESDEFHTFKNGTCTRCGAAEKKEHVHIDKDNNCVCDGPECTESMHSELSNGICNKCKKVVKPENHTHENSNNDTACDSCGETLVHTCVDEDGNCVCDGPNCTESMHSELSNGICSKCKKVVKAEEHTEHTDSDADNKCDFCEKTPLVQNPPEETNPPAEHSNEHDFVDANGDDKCDNCNPAPTSTDLTEGDQTVASVIFRKFNLLSVSSNRFIKYDTKSAPVYDTSSAKVYETETTYIYTGWQTIDGATYYFDKNGNKVTGEQVIEGIPYTFSSDGVRSGTIGIDVSKYQTGINWTKVKNAGINFVMIRCGYRGYGSGVLVEDPMYRSHISGAKAAGLRVGVYFFSQAVNEAEAVEEASMAVSLAKKYGINMPIAIDSEYAAGGRGRADGLSKSARTAVTKAFCDTVKSAGYTPMVYASKSWFSDHLNASQLSSYRIWVAHYAEKCGYTGKYHIWQNTDKGKVEGVPGYVDMNISSI